MQESLPCPGGRPRVRLTTLKTEDRTLLLSIYLPLQGKDRRLSGKKPTIMILSPSSYGMQWTVINELYSCKLNNMNDTDDILYADWSITHTTYINNDEFFWIPTNYGYCMAFFLCVYSLALEAYQSHGELFDHGPEHISSYKDYGVQIGYIQPIRSNYQDLIVLVYSSGSISISLIKGLDDYPFKSIPEISMIDTLCSIPICDTINRMGYHLSCETILREGMFCRLS